MNHTAADNLLDCIVTYRQRIQQLEQELDGLREAVRTFQREFCVYLNTEHPGHDGALFAAVDRLLDAAGVEITGGGDARMLAAVEQGIDWRAILVIPRRPPLSPNTTGNWHWSRLRAYRALYHQEAVAAWMQAGAPRFQRPRVTLRCYYRGDRIIRDRDNLYASVRDIVNGLAGRAFSDDAMDVIDLHVEAHVDTRDPRVEVEIEETLRSA